MDRKKFFRMQAMVLVLVSFSFISLHGCSPAMRKKFVRQKKKDDIAEVIPVLNPQEYENQMESVKTRYDYFYALLKVWHKDAQVLIDDEYSTKQIVYTFRQIRLQLEELGKLIDGNPQAVIDDGLEKIDALLEYCNQPEAFRNRDMIRKDIRQLRNEVIDPLAFEFVKNYLRSE